MMSVKQEGKRLSGENMATGPVIRVGPIINPTTNETISIVIPLSPSGQLSGLPSRIITERTISGKDTVETRIEEVTGTIIEERDMKAERARAIVSQPEQQESLILAMSSPNEPTKTREKSVPSLLSSTSSTSSQIRADKTKGCPFPTCSRYRRAFSRAHDLKRHIARHETRKERLVENSRDDIRTCFQCGESFLNEIILQRHERTHNKQQENANLPLVLSTTPSSSVTPASRNHCYPCNVCKKKYANENKLKEHLVTHDKTSTGNSCLLCGCEFNDAEKLQNHMREHTTNMLQSQQHLTTNGMSVENSQGSGGIKVESAGALKQELKSDEVVEEDEDEEFMLEEMLLLNKNPRLMRASIGSSTSTNNGASIGSVMASSSSTSVTSSSSSSSPNIVPNANKIRCDYCSKTFKTKWTLSSHVAAHEGRFQFGCTRCGKKFVRKSHFEGHVRSHEAARPYVCEQCGKTFKELKHRREHTKRKHPGNQNAIQNLLDSISACVSEESSVGEQAKFALLMPMNFGA
ncbi:myoneurin-like [Venturia canescens]|uniref:myoneurin-like n=1 Tax=Venturia canescens TaxID=32260 RepID=UPI001C9C57F1|nr:myoneurin-like [Venturia canescens]